MRGWQLRRFELCNGQLFWWETPAQAASGMKPNRVQDLIGMKVRQDVGSSSTFSLSTTIGEDKVYELDAIAAQFAAAAGWGVAQVGRSLTLDAATWIKALEQECIFHRQLRLETSGDPKADCGRSLLREALAT
ncbi:unnamed protein product [Polarella glacialis]|uniref:Uncharacterized protein n=1 Tax=Polarella glacialis TaxID=89957 RepID=A0A813HAD6_POLGL|nr:unnamed protein product [Polarella glacialis]